MSELENSNLFLWSSVEKTDPKHTKGAKIGMMKITAICPQAQRMRATEVFGPFGSGWGVREDGDSYKYLDFPDGTKLCIYRAELWYILDGKQGIFPITGNTKVAFVTQAGKGYLKIDDEFSKKVATDALTKGLSALGFNADIFLGKYDDSKYVNQMEEEFNPAPPKEEEQAKAKTGPSIQDIFDAFKVCGTLAALEAKKAKADTTEHAKDLGMIKAYEARKKELI